MSKIPPLRDAPKVVGRCSQWSPDTVGTQRGTRHDRKKVGTKVRTSLVSMFLAITCLSCFGIHDVELARLASPDGRVEAVFIQNADYGGITTGFTYCLYIVKKGGDPEQGDYLMTVDRIEDFEFHWREDKHLEIQYRYADASIFPEKRQVVRHPAGCVQE